VVSDDVRNPSGTRSVADRRGMRSSGDRLHGRRSPAAGPASAAQIESSSVTSLRFADVSWHSGGLGVQAGIGTLA
jgi:hypothetical protein